MAMQQTYISQDSSKSFKIWAWSCPHLNADITQGSQNNIEIAIAQFQALGLEFDLSICAGDYDSQQDPPDVTVNASEGEQMVTTLENLSDVGLTPSGLYRIAGNHDAGDAEMNWFRRYIDPIGENTAYSQVDPTLRPYPVTLMGEDTWHSYYVTVGKNIILCLSDRNDLPYPYGRGGSVESGGHPSGAITKASWEWAKSVILGNPDKNIIVMTHQNPRNTTIGTGDGDGSLGIETSSNLHGESGIALGSGSLYSIYDEDLETADSPTTQFLDFLEANPTHTVIAWVAGHSHSFLDETLNGRGERFDANGVSFINLGHLTRYHIGTGRKPTHSMSKVIEISSKYLKIKHFNHQIISGNAIGFYEPLEYNIPLKV